MMDSSEKAYNGLGTEGPIATRYAKNTARDVRRFASAARVVQDNVAPGARVLEVAPGPGYLAIEIAKSGRAVTGLDISETFVRIAREIAAKAGVSIDFQHGNASQMPFPDNSFDFIICTAAFKNFADPIGALNEMYRVLKLDSRASVMDLRKDVSSEEITNEVRGMQSSPLSAMMTRWIFKHMLLKRAYTRAALEEMAAKSRFGRSEIVNDGIGFDWRFMKGR